MEAVAAYKQLLVGTETSDDAAVWQLDANTCIIATTDFFMPMVDDPYDFGRIAATNAISDVYAMGGKPIMALAILGMPVDKIPVEMVREILKGGAAVCGSAGIPVAGGHSIDCPEPVYGLAVIGICRPDQVRRNADAKAGDKLILTKPVGVGIYSAAIKNNALLPEVTRLLREQGAEDVLVFAGGIIPEQDVQTLKTAGIDEIFLPGTSTKSIVAYLQTRLAAA